MLEAREDHGTALPTFLPLAPAIPESSLLGCFTADDCNLVLVFKQLSMTYGQKAGQSTALQATL